MRTKADVLLEREKDAQVKYERIREYRELLQLTPLELPCAGCGTTLETEWDFASHFVIPDERYLNLGECPNRKSHLQ